MNAIDYFLKYIQINTTSDPDSESVPSTEGQLKLANLLLEDLKKLKIENSFIKKGYVYAKLANNTSVQNIKSIGLIAHMDTSNDSSGENINYKIIENYQGESILLNKERDIKLSPKEFKCLNSCIGHDLVVTDGTTLLGADDKAGIAEIMALIDQIQTHQLPHGDLYICFTPDEEIGRGVDHFDYDFFKVDFAYTLDGSEVGFIDYQNFNAASAVVHFYGKSIHPGDAKNKMINSILLFEEFNSLLPKFLNPAFTERDEGFNHLTNITGNVENTTASYIIRNHYKDLFLKQQEDFKKIADFINQKYGYVACHVTIEESYANMFDILQDHMEPILIAKEAISQFLEPKSAFIRGGTDGSRLTFNHVLCPNLGTGGYNFHGPYEFLSVHQMNLSVNILDAIIKLLLKEN